MKAGVSLLILLFLMACPAGVSGAQSQETPDDVYLICHMKDSVHSVLYLSNIFLGDSTRNVDYRRDFEFMVRERYPRAMGEVDCPADSNRLAAEQRQRKYMSLFANLYRSVVDTGWQPE